MPSAKHFPLKTIIVLVVTFFVSGGLAYATVPASGGVLIFRKQKPPIPPLNPLVLVSSPMKPQTEVCPINGKLYSKSEEALWQTRRPILAMIENHIDARPHPVFRLPTSFMRLSLKVVLLVSWVSFTAVPKLTPPKLPRSGLPVCILSILRPSTTPRFIYMSAAVTVVVIRLQVSALPIPSYGHRRISQTRLEKTGW